MAKIICIHSYMTASYCSTNKMIKKCYDNLVCDLHYVTMKCKKEKKGGNKTFHWYDSANKEQKDLKTWRNIFELSRNDMLPLRIKIETLIAKQQLQQKQQVEINTFLNKKFSQLLGSNQIVDFHFAFFILILLGNINTYNSLNTLGMKHITINALDRYAKDKGIKINSKQIVSNFTLNINDTKKEIQNIINNYLNKEVFIHKNIDNSIN